MSWRTTGILFIVLVLVGGLVYLQSRQNETDTAEPTPGSPVPAGVAIFDQVEIDDVVRVDISAGGDEEVSFSHEPDGAWSMTVPSATNVISQTVTNSLLGLINTTSRRTLSPGENPLEAYGLHEPAREITIAVAREDQVVRYRLLVGNETPAGDAYYVLEEGDPRIHLMTKSTLDGIFTLATNPPLPESLPTPIATLPVTATVTVTGTATPAITLTPTLTPSP